MTDKQVADVTASMEKVSTGNHDRRDRLKAIEARVQGLWDEANLHEVDVDLQKPKYMVTFPYPYTNGKLHLGHSFTFLKAEFAALYKRMKGFNVLYPFGFHVTGMPIKAAADRLASEIEEFGCPPVFPSAEEAERRAAEAAAAKADAVVDITKFKSAKTKTKAKTGAVKYQWDILLSMGIDEESLPEFANTDKWLEFFPPAAMTDLKDFGMSVDWRRSFITTIKNPFYDSFVKWQFNILKEQDKIGFGPRYDIYSPKDGQGCAAHERRVGEDVGVQDYTIIKMEVVKNAPPALQAIIDSGKRSFMGCATLRPETMYGQTNCWILPEGEYGAYALKNNEVIVCTERAARNMAYQDLTEVAADFTALATFTGVELLGVGLSAPLTPYEVVYTLPMLTIKTTMGTGIVTSVPSDSPDDLATLRDVLAKPAFYQEPYGITMDMVEPFKPVPIINIPGLGDSAAETVVDQLKIKSQKDTALLAKAKEITYTRGFYEGTLIVGPHAGKAVQVVKDIVRDELIADNAAFLYREPNGLVVSRSGETCVVAKGDQWFLRYGEEQWRNQAQKCLDDMEVFHEETRNGFNRNLTWLKEWACSRKFGLGTRLPWDEKWLVESLSDSTIYMAYYTVAHFLQGGKLEGNGANNVAGVTAEQMTQEAWEFVFRKGPAPSSPESATAEQLEPLRASFEYWYPLDLRVSGRDLVNNHLTMSIYNHTAVWPEDAQQWPRAFRSNGHLMLNGSKMSKNNGNFMTLRDAIEEFGVDATRFTLADAGDGVEDSNFVSDVATQAILRLTALLQWVEVVKSVVADPSCEAARHNPTRTGETTFADKVFLTKVKTLANQAGVHYENMLYREVVQTAFYGMVAARDTYRTSCHNDGIHLATTMEAVEIITLCLQPIIPHWAQSMWETLGKEGLAKTQDFPVFDDMDTEILAKSEFVDQALYTARSAITKIVKNTVKKSKGAIKKLSDVKIGKVTLYVATGYPEWQKSILRELTNHFDAESKTFDVDKKSVAKVVMADPLVKAQKKKAMPFAVMKMGAASKQGLSALDLESKFDEELLLNEVIPITRATLECQDIVVVREDPEVLAKSRIIVFPGAAGAVVEIVEPVVASE